MVLETMYDTGEATQRLQEIGKKVTKNTLEKWRSRGKEPSYTRVMGKIHYFDSAIVCFRYGIASNDKNLLI